MKNIPKKYLVLGGVALLLVVGYFSLGSGVGGVLPPNCTNLAWVNTSSTINTTATQIVTAAQMNCPVRLTVNQGNTAFCHLEQKTAASSSVTANTGIKLVGSTSTVGVNTLSFGFEPGEVNGSGYNLNCLSTPSAGGVTILRKNL